MPSRCLATLYASLRVPQVSAFSTFPPFSVQVCSITESTFFTSSSAVAGRAIKIKSYSRSSMLPSFLFSPGNRPANLLIRFRFFLRRFLSPVVLVHGRIDSLRYDHFRCVSRFRDHLRRDFQLRLAHRPQHILFAAAHFVLRSATKPQSRKHWSPQRPDHRLRTVVAARAALAADPNRAHRQLRFVPHHQQVARTQLVLFQQLAHRNAAQIHVRLRFCQQYIFSRQLSPPDQRLAFRPRNTNPVSIRQLIYRHESQIVRRPLILRIGIAKSNNQPHTLRIPRKAFRKSFRKSFRTSCAPEARSTDRRVLLLLLALVALLRGPRPGSFF